MKLFSSLVIAFVLFIPRGWAQDASSEDIVKTTQNDLLLVGAAGVGGAVLGLSTLSFYDKPSKHVANIWMGAAIGIIAGVVIVALNNAQRSQEAFESYQPVRTPDFETFERDQWHLAHLQEVAPYGNEVSASIWSANF